MEYTKDLILNVRYDEVNNTIRFKTKNRTSRFLQAVIKHKLITTAVISAIIFISIDVVLITNFFRILTNL